MPLARPPQLMADLPLPCKLLAAQQQLHLPGQDTHGLCAVAAGWWDGVASGTRRAHMPFHLGARVQAQRHHAVHHLG